jgi:uncharacterized protein (TIGR03382 family)
MRTTLSHTLMLAGVLGIAVPAVGVSTSVAETVTVTATSAPTTRGQFAPASVIAIWIEDAAGNFVKTIGRQSAVRTQYLLGWIAKAGPNDIDALTGASRTSHVTPVTVTWDAKDKAGVVVPDGQYVIRIEMADSNVASVAENNEATLPFNLNGISSTALTAATGGFTNVAVKYAAGNPADCNNGTIDRGELCDGNCPATCAKPADACVESKLTGAAATCDAVCVESPVTACKGGDGCCAAGCTNATDSDCAAGTGPGTGPQAPTGADGSNQVAEGGCQTGSGGAGAMLALGAIGLLLRRRK